MDVRDETNATTSASEDTAWPYTAIAVVSVLILALIWFTTWNLLVRKSSARAWRGYYSLRSVYHQALQSVTERDEIINRLLEKLGNLGDYVHTLHETNTGYEDLLMTFKHKLRELGVPVHVGPSRHGRPEPRTSVAQDSVTAFPEYDDPMEDDRFTVGSSSDDEKDEHGRRSRGEVSQEPKGALSPPPATHQHDPATSEPHGETSHDDLMATRPRYRHHVLQRTGNVASRVSSTRQSDVRTHSFRAPSYRSLSDELADCMDQEDEEYNDDVHEDWDQRGEKREEEPMEADELARGVKGADMESRELSRASKVPLPESRPGSPGPAL
ncbi:hypothetical protein GQ53DRAFT_828118 [Thozetella sp. PMI_491]|nr:hypothetical protein GQ53DRAFT_828118 [Thozetella sp. PMI_491]